MQIKYIKIKEIRRDEEQPRKHFDEETLERLVISIKDNGIEQPVTVRKNGSGYILVDGERRWRASQKAGLEELPCIITDKEDILEQQLRSDCLKEDLTVDELDRAIYRYYEVLKTQTSLRSNDEGFKKVAKSIGKSDVRVKKAIDRFEFKQKNKEFTEKIEKQYNPENKRFGKVNSTIAKTDTPALKKNPEIRKAVIETSLKERDSITNSHVDEKIKAVERAIEKDENLKPEDVQTIFNQVEVKKDPLKHLERDPRTVLQNMMFEYNAVVQKIKNLKFEQKGVREMIQGKKLQEFIQDSEDFTNYLISLED